MFYKLELMPFQTCNGWYKSSEDEYRAMDLWWKPFL